MHESFELPGYEILEKIGAGGTSSVWKARQLSLDRLVAIKTLDSSFLPDQAALARFRQEAQAAARLKHPSIVQMYDAGEYQGRPYLVMEYIGGCSVGDLVQRAGRLTERNALLIAEGVANALAYAWDKDCIIHLDVKPDNVLVENDGAIKVTDLGLARFIGMHRRRLDDDSIMGTPNYVSPEQAQGVEDLDCRTDIYSLGAMLYHLVTGRMPFAGRPGSAAMDAHVDEFLPDPVDIQVDLSPACAWLIEKMMVKDRAFRPAYWRVVLTDLVEVQAGRMPLAPLPEPGQSTVLRSIARPQPKPTPPPSVRAVEAGPAKRRIVIHEAEATQAGTRPSYQDREIGRALIQLFLLLIGALCVGIYFYTGTSRPVASAPPVVEPSAPARVVERVVDRAPPAWDNGAPAQDPTDEPMAEIDWGVEERTEPPSEPEPQFEPRPAPRPALTRAAPSEVKEGAVVWENAEFKEGARLFNDAYNTYVTFQKTRENRASLKLAERQVRQALRNFESVKNQAPPDVDMDTYIKNCYHMIADIRHSTLMQREE